ncbi:porin [Castellaniella hirudinis]|uniref:Porin n=1 Tax=Castellaniella hirudinis TaxID=1144617 RepID=A0ABV8RZ68_9BURK
MKKTLLAAALLAGFATAGVAQAETSVTLYGILDTGYGYQNFKYDHNGADVRARSSGLRDGTFNGSRWGLKGAEDLGDGLRAIFQVEAHVNLGGEGGAAQSGFNRQSFVGLSSDSWGTFTMGRQYSAGTETFMGPNGVNLGDADKVFGSVGLGGGTRVNNSFKYVTPDMAGFKVIALYGTGTDGSTWVTRDGDKSLSDRGTRVSLGASYVNGPISVGASYDRQSVTGATSTTGAPYALNPATGKIEGTKTTTNGSPSALTNWQISAAYDFEVVKLGLGYGQDRHGKIGWNGGAESLSTIAEGMGNGSLDTANYSFKSNNYHVGLSAPIGGGTLYAGWNYSTSNLDDANAWGDEAGNISAYQVNYVYPLSKRTSLYTYASYMKNVGYVKDLKGTEAGVGINHKF